MENHREGEEWRLHIQKQLSDTGIIFFSPYQRPFLNDIPEDEEARKELAEGIRKKDFDFVSDRMKQIRSHDLRLCDVSDFLIVRLDPAIPTYGSVEEITTMVRQKKPMFIYVVGGKEKIPLWLLGMHPHKYFYETLEDLIQTIREIDQEVIELSSDRWKLLKPEYR